MGSVRGLAASIVAATIASCGSPQRAGAPAPAPLEVKTYGPLGSKADAKAAHQAVILGTDDKGGSTILPLPVTEARAQVDSMYVKLGEPITGGLSPIKLTTAPNPDHAVQVGVFEEMAGGAGPQWRAGVWIAAIVAATTLNKDLTDFTFSASVSGYIDGASASGLVAAGFLAALTGATIDPTATLTGAINPDGTISPVGGVPDKLVEAARNGKKRIGYPIGMRQAKSVKTGELVDLEQLARTHNVQAIEVADVYGAYKLLTGKQLPAPVPVSAAEMELDAATIKEIDAKYKQWQQRLATEWAAILQLESAGRVPQLLGHLRDYSKKNGEEAEALKKRGLHGAAYSRMFSASLYAMTANQAYDILAKVRANKIEDAVAVLAKHDNIGEATHAVFAKVGAGRPPTMGGHMQMLAAFRAALRGWVFESFATQSVAATKAHLRALAGKTTAELGSDQVAESVIQFVVPTLLYVAKTSAETTLAAEQLEVQAASDIDYMCSLPNVNRMATSFESAGSASINYFDALFVLPYAVREKLSDDDARRRVAVAEPDYLVAFMNASVGSHQGLPKQLKDTWGEDSLPWRLLSLAGSQLAFFHAAELLAKHYSLQADVSPDGSGRVQKVEHEKAFANMLANAERTARASARAARVATGTIPVQARLAYQNATIDRDGTLADKLDALAQFWASSAYSQTAVMLARN